MSGGELSPLPRARIALTVALFAAIPLLIVACTPATGGSEADDSTPRTTLVDAAGDTVEFSSPPGRIVSLVPSVTEVIVDLGEADRLVGRTRYDTASVIADLPSVGEGMGPSYEALLALDPDLVVYFFGASDPETPAQLARLGIPGFGVRPERIEDVLALYAVIGELLGRQEAAEAFSTALRQTLDSVARISAGLPRRNVSYLLDGDPPWAAGPGTYIGELIDLAGGDLLPEDLPDLYAQISPEGLVAAPLEVILLSGTSRIDDRLARGRRLERIPAWVELPGPAVRDAAWVILRAIHPEAGGR